MPEGTARATEWTDDSGEIHRLEVEENGFRYTKNGEDGCHVLIGGPPDASLKDLPPEAMPVVGALARYLIAATKLYTDAMRRDTADAERQAIVDIVKEADWMSGWGRERLTRLIKERDKGT